MEEEHWQWQLWSVARPGMDPVPNIDIAQVVGDALTPFAKCCINLFSFWPVMRYAIQCGAPEDAIYDLSEDIVDLFYNVGTSPSSVTKSVPDLPEQEKIEDMIIDFMENDCQIGLEDDSERLVSRDLIKLFKECVDYACDPTCATPLAVEFARLAGMRDVSSQALFQTTGDDDSDDSESDDAADGGMDVDAAASRPKPERQFDDDGFEIVQRRRR